MEIDILISPEKSFGSQCRFCSSEPWRATFSPQNTLPAYAMKKSALFLEISSATITRSMTLPPRPPSLSSNGMRKRPSSTQASKSSEGYACSRDRKSTRLNSSHTVISYAVFCLKKKKHDGPIHASDDCNAFGMTHA